SKRIYVATSDMAVHGVAGTAGGWRYDGSWNNLLANATSNDSGKPGPPDEPNLRCPSPPTYAGPNRFVVFPTQNPVWSDVALLANGWVVAALGTPNGTANPGTAVSSTTNNNAVYYTGDPKDANPNWFIGGFRTMIGDPGKPVNWDAGNIKI